jgi:class 3 adenylate cyclase
MECPSCRADVPEGKRFCLECGAALPAPCPSCGSRNPSNAKFCGDCGAKLEAAAMARPATASAERRQLTVMFCDLVGSTALASRLDPEDLREVIGAYQRCAAEVINRAGGFLAKYMGDGVLAYFGYPQAHEDDAERAVRAALELVGTVGQLRARERLRVRIGIATGLVVVGDLIGTGAAQEQAVVGETPNLAARLQSLAEPDSVVIAARAPPKAASRRCVPARRRSSGATKRWKFCSGAGTAPGPATAKWFCSRASRASGSRA